MSSRTPGARATIALGVLLLAPGLLGGCVTDSKPEEDTIRIPMPELGERFSYRTANGTFLNVTVQEVAPRLAGDLSSSQALLVNWTLDSDGFAETFEFQEAVDLQMRTPIQQVAFCGLRVAPSAQGKMQCLDERALVVFPSSLVLAGFGSAPLWGDRLAEGADPLMGDDGPGRAEPLRYQFSSHEELASGCLMGRPATPVETSKLRPLRYSVSDGSFAVCDGVSFPVLFEPVRGPTFQLVAHDPGDGDLSADRPVGSRAPALPQVEWRAPFLVDPRTPTEANAITVREAHQEALSESRNYSRIFDGEESAWIVGTRIVLEQTRRSTDNGTVVERQETWARELVALNETGSQAEVVVEKEIRWARGTNGTNRTTNTTRVVSEETSHSERPPTPQSLNATQAAFAPSLALGERLTGQDVDEAAGIGMRHRLRAHAWSGVAHDDWEPRRDGYTVVLWFEDPTPRTSLGTSVETPYGVTIDGPTGDIRWATLNGSRLPLTAGDIAGWR